LTIRTTKGAVAVVFSWGNTIATTSEVMGSSFVEGSFGSSYNSGYWTFSSNKMNNPEGIWAPAIAEDVSNGIIYYNGSTRVRSISKATLDMWKWANGYSTVVSGYAFSVDDNGVLTVKKDNTVVMKIR
jgi:hypothetical protein